MGDDCYSHRMEEERHKLMYRALIITAGVVTIAAVMALSGCEDRYRYPCQEPQNFNKSECNPPQCHADETCTEYLIDK